MTTPAIATKKTLNVHGYLSNCKNGLNCTACKIYTMISDATHPDESEPIVRIRKSLDDHGSKTPEILNAPVRLVENRIIEKLPEFQIDDQSLFGRSFLSDDIGNFLQFEEPHKIQETPTLVNSATVGPKPVPKSPTASQEVRSPGEAPVGSPQEQHATMEVEKKMRTGRKCKNCITVPRRHKRGKEEVEDPVRNHLVAPVPNLVTSKTDFRLLEQPQELQRRAYRNESRYILPNPLVLSQATDQKITKAYAVITVWSAYDVRGAAIYYCGGKAIPFVSSADGKMFLEFAIPAHGMDTNGVYFIQADLHYKKGNETCTEKIRSLSFKMIANKQKRTHEPEIPMITSMLPKSMDYRMAGEHVWIRGQNFIDRQHTKVWFGEVEAAIAEVDRQGNILVCMLPDIGPITENKTVPVAVFNYGMDECVQSKTQFYFTFIAGSGSQEKYTEECYNGLEFDDASSSDLCPGTPLVSDRQDDDTPSFSKKLRTDVEIPINPALVKDQYETDENLSPAAPVEPRVDLHCLPFGSEQYMIAWNMQLQGMYRAYLEQLESHLQDHIQKQNSQDNVSGYFNTINPIS